MRKHILLVLVLALLLAPHAVSFAANESKGVSINGDISPQSFNYLAKAQSLMFVNTNNTISVKGETSAYTNVEKIAVTVYLEKYASGSWSVVYSWYFSKNDASSVVGTATSSNISPGTYRVRSYHRIDNEGTVETTNSYSIAQTI